MKQKRPFESCLMINSRWSGLLQNSFQRKPSRERLSRSETAGVRFYISYSYGCSCAKLLRVSLPFNSTPNTNDGLQQSLW